MNLVNPDDKGKLFDASYALPPSCRGSDYPDSHDLYFRNHIVLNKDMILSIISSGRIYARAPIIDT